MHYERCNILRLSAENSWRIKQRLKCAQALHRDNSGEESPRV